MNRGHGAQCLYRPSPAGVFFNAIRIRIQILLAGPGQVVGLRELLLGQRIGEDVGPAGGQATIWRIPEKAFRAIARQHPDLSLLLFQAAFGATGALTQALQARALECLNTMCTQRESCSLLWITTYLCCHHVGLYQEPPEHVSNGDDEAHVKMPVTRSR